MGFWKRAPISRSPHDSMSSDIQTGSTRHLPPGRWRWYGLPMGCRADLSDCARAACSPAPNSPRSSKLAKPRSTNGDGKGFYDGTFTGMITGACTNLRVMSCSSEVQVDAKQRGQPSSPLQLPDKVQCETYSLLCGQHTGVMSGVSPIPLANARVSCAIYPEPLSLSHSIEDGTASTLANRCSTAASITSRTSLPV